MLAQFSSLRRWVVLVRWKILTISRRDDVTAKLPSHAAVGSRVGCIAVVHTMLWPT